MTDIEIEIEKIIDRTTYCNRKWFNQKQIDKLANSIKIIGLQNPIIIRKLSSNNNYQLIAGETRTRAIESLGIKTIQAKIVELTDKDADRWSFESNLFHEEGSLHPIEQGFFFKKLRNNDVSLNKIATELDISKTKVENYLSLTNLSPEMQDIMLPMGQKFKVAQALQLVRLAPYEASAQKAVWDKFLAIRDKRQQTAQELEKLVNRKIKELDAEKARLKELEDILAMYWDQTPDVVDELRGKYENLGYNNDQIRGEISRLNERRVILDEFKQSEDINEAFIEELDEWIEKNNPSNRNIRRRIQEYYEEQQATFETEEPEFTQTIFLKNSHIMEDIPNKSVNLVVTSPPYWNLKDYGPTTQIGFYDSFEDYIKNLIDVFKECARVLVPGGRMCINVGDVFTETKKFGRYKVWPVHARIIIACENLNLDYTNTHIWYKIGHSIGSGGITGGKFGSFPNPPNGIINNDIEYILTFRKIGERVKPSSEIVSLHKFDESEWTDHWGQVYKDMRPVSQKKGHPAVFPELLPQRMIRMFTFEGETVLDPFLGTGTTCKVAYAMKRNSFGYENNPKFTTIIKDKCPEAKIVDLDGKIIQNHSSPAAERKQRKLTEIIT